MSNLFSVLLFSVLQKLLAGFENPLAFNINGNGACNYVVNKRVCPRPYQANQLRNEKHH